MQKATLPLRGVIHGRVIELEEAPALLDGQKVSVQVQPLEEPPKWLEQFTVDPSVAPGKLLIKGTRLLAEDVAQELEGGRSDEELLKLHAELTQEHVVALHEYVRVPALQRRLFGAWAEDADELDQFLEEIRRHRKQR